jgi:hypothetical protein
VIFERQEAYHSDSEGSLVGCAIGVSLAHSGGGDAGGDCMGGIDEGAGAGGANIGDDNDDGADLARVGAAEEQRHPHRYVSAQVEVVAANASSCTEGVHTNEVKPCQRTGPVAMPQPRFPGGPALGHGDEERGFVCAWGHRPR